MIALVAQSCKDCGRPWCATAAAVRRYRACPFCGAASIQTGDPSPVCNGCGAVLREVPPDGFCGWCEELAAS